MPCDILSGHATISPMTLKDAEWRAIVELIREAQRATRGSVWRGGPEDLERAAEAAYIVQVEAETRAARSAPEGKCSRR